MDETIHVLEADYVLTGTFAFDSVIDPGFVYLKMPDFNDRVKSYPVSSTHRPGSQVIDNRLERLRSEQYTDLVSET